MDLSQFFSLQIFKKIEKISKKPWNQSKGYNSSNQIVLHIIENGGKLDLIYASKPNSKFVLTHSHEEELIMKKDVGLLKGKKI